MIERRISPWVDEFNGFITALGDRPDASQLQDDVVYVIKDVFTTRDGSWEPSDLPGSIPQWARDDYLAREFNNAGGDHHLFAAVIGLDGQFMQCKGIFFWSDGLRKLGYPNYSGYVPRETDPSSGWGDIPVFAGYFPDQGQSGPWCWTTVGPADVMGGGGLPYNLHVSWFVVWQAMRRSDYENGGDGDDSGDGGTPDSGVINDLMQRIAMLEYRVARLEAVHPMAPTHDG